MSLRGIFKRTEETRRKTSEAKRGKNNPMYGKRHSEEIRLKISEAMMGHEVSSETRRRISKSAKGRKRSEESKRKQSEARTGKKYGSPTEDTRRRISEANLGKKRSEEIRRRHSAAQQGIPFEDWTHYVSYEPYCHLFNLATKERIRNQHLRTCVISGKSILQEGQRLNVHHIDNNKQQGCDGIKWRLVPVTQSWNSKLKNPQIGLLLNLLLIKNPRAQINVGHG